MSKVRMPDWERFITFRASARFTGQFDEVDPTWELTPMAVTLESGRKAFGVSARLVMMEEGHEMATQIAIVAIPEDDAEPFPPPSAGHEIATRVNDLLWDRSTQIAMASAALVGVSLSRQATPPDPVIGKTTNR